MSILGCGRDLSVYFTDVLEVESVAQLWQDSIFGQEESYADSYVQLCALTVRALPWGIQRQAHAWRTQTARSEHPRDCSGHQLGDIPQLPLPAGERWSSVVQQQHADLPEL